jgi:dihydrodipicolinate synthase/N-acetylneuraminate lyase
MVFCSMVNNILSGIIVPLVTPVTGNLEFDRGAFLKLVEHVIGGGVNGIFIMGTTGEGASLTDRMRNEIIETAVSSVAGRVPVLVNITSPSYLESLDYARWSAETGADFVVLAPPFYFVMNQQELLRYYKSIAESSSLPLFIYNAPQYTGNILETRTVRELATHPNIAGIKDSSGDMNYIKQLLGEREEENFSILIGPEKWLADCILMGGDGGVNGGANLFPGLYVRMFRAAKEVDREKMRYYQEFVNRMYEDVYEVPGSPMGIIIALKYALSVKGICLENMAVPVYDRMTDLQKKKIDEFLKEMENYDF